MKGILAVKNGSGVFLSRSEQIEELMKKGFSVYAYDDGNKELIASPNEELSGSDLCANSRTEGDANYGTKWEQ